jgi:ABC-type uncharacterized transport system substrate-binding protein
VVAEVVFDEARDEEVAVIVTFPHPELERYVAPPANVLEEFGLELTFKKRILGALVHE